MKKEVYMIEAEELVFLTKAKQHIQILVTKEKLIELFNSNYKIYSAILVDEDDLDKYVHLGNVKDVK